MGNDFMSESQTEFLSALGRSKLHITLGTLLIAFLGVVKVTMLVGSYLADSRHDMSDLRKDVAVIRASAFRTQDMQTWSLQAQKLNAGFHAPDAVRIVSERVAGEAQDNVNN